VAESNLEVSRRQALLTVAGVTLLPACGTSRETTSPSSSSAPPSPSLSGDSHPSPTRSTPTSPASPSASVTPSNIPSFGRPEYYVHTGHRGIALTIDDGPDPRYTPEILKILERNMITATFCMIGQSVQRHTALVREVQAHGHLIANHTWSHPDLARRAPVAVRDEIHRAQDATAKATGYHPTLFRAPFGAWSAITMRTCAQMDLRPLDWSVDPRDWSRPGTDRIVQTVLRGTRPGSIILEHDGGGDRAQTVAALREFLPRLRERGYQFVTP
jgi:peptidoglycan/xylan/chitin deacetylase (PgdA/CDA1 family)